MKLVKITFEVVIDEDSLDGEYIQDYLNHKLYTDPEFFGSIKSSNIEVKDTEE